MLPAATLHNPPGGRFAANVVHFARLLRKAGLPVGTDRPLLALQALKVAGVASRADLYAVLRACLVDRIEHRAIFDQAFYVFWRDPELLEQILALLLPAVPAPRPRSRSAPSRRLAQALVGNRSPEADFPPAPLAVIGLPSWSDQESLRTADFDSMTAEEWTAAQRAVKALAPWFRRIVTRRDARAASGSRIDLRALLRASGRLGGDGTVLARKTRRTRPEPLVAIVDISGSMSRYSRVFLHFMHAMANGEIAFSAFVFGTRLTTVTRQLRAYDPDEALARVAGEVRDWSGGTRIGPCLREFNMRWARRLPLQKATVLLVSDGLEHAEIDLLSAEAARLGRSCGRLFWLNPLLRYKAFEPKARGVRALLPHVDRLLPMHNIVSLEQVALALSATRLTSLGVPLAPLRTAHR
jgi:uncharacterized protein with von Willebrand factor type A (vWA) domain